MVLCSRPGGFAEMGARLILNMSTPENSAKARLKCRGSHFSLPEDETSMGPVRLAAGPQFRTQTGWACSIRVPSIMPFAQQGVKQFPLFRSYVKPVLCRGIRTFKSPGRVLSSWPQPS